MHLFLGTINNYHNASKPCASGNPTMKSAEMLFHGSTGVSGTLIYRLAVAGSSYIFGMGRSHRHI